MMGRRALSLLGLAFFGLTSEGAPQARMGLFKQIHDIIFHGKGGYDWHTVYNMPIWLRNFTFFEIQKFYEKEKEEYKKAQSKSSNKSTMVDSSGKVNTPEFAKASKQYKASYKP